MTQTSRDQFKHEKLSSITFENPHPFIYNSQNELQYQNKKYVIEFMYQIKLQKLIQKVDIYELENNEAQNQMRSQSKSIMELLSSRSKYREVFHSCPLPSTDFRKIIKQNGRNYRHVAKRLLSVELACFVCTLGIS